MKMEESVDKNVEAKGDSIVTYPMCPAKTEGKDEDFLTKLYSQITSS